MRYVYFTKLLQSLDVPALVAFLKDCGLDGADLAVRPGYPVTPDNAAAELPKAAKAFKDAGLVVGLVSTPTTLNDADVAASKTIFEACAKAEVPAVKIGYFAYQGKFDAALAEARRVLPNISLAWLATNIPIRDPAEMEHYLEGFRRAGLT